MFSSFYFAFVKSVCGFGCGSGGQLTSGHHFDWFRGCKGGASQTSVLGFPGGQEVIVPRGQGVSLPGVVELKLHWMNETLLFF